MIDFKYRPDVDGLRAVAVTLVLLFHAGLGFSGGFIGVDVFFVISGFLITGLILKEQDAEKFSLANFWVRRIRRIIPAATVMVVGVLIAGFFLLLPYDYEELAKSAVAQQLMLSNVFFWQDTGYFAGPSDLKPLLHSWSLAVEEQFYLGYPFLLIFLRRWGRKISFLTLLCLAVVSLAVSEYGVHHHRSATFFLLPTRAWELLVGGLVCFFPAPTRIPRWVLSMLSWFSFGAILGVGWFYDSNTPFPGILALIPCFATALLIYSNSTYSTFPAAILSKRPIVFIGLISYSLYLWHWPILAYFRYWLGSELPGSLGVTALGLSFIISVLVWRYIETPLRCSHGCKPKWKAPSLVWACSIMILGVVSCFIISLAGFSGRLPNDIAKILEEPTYETSVGRSTLQWQSRDLPVLGPVEKSDSIDAFVWGDSHAGVIADVVSDLAHEERVSVVIASQPATIPLPEVFNRFSPKKEQILRADAVLGWLADTQAKNLILVANWQLYHCDEGTYAPRHANEEGKVVANGRATLVEQLRRLCEEMQEKQVHLWIAKRVPHQTFDPRRRLAASLLLRDKVPNGISLQQYVESDSPLNAILDEIDEEFEHVTVLDPARACFNASGSSLIGDRTGAYYRDVGHLSPYGAEKFYRPILQPIFKGIGSESPNLNTHKP